jgi:hypothetical protein
VTSKTILSVLCVSLLLLHRTEFGQFLLEDIDSVSLFLYDMLRRNTSAFLLITHPEESIQILSLYTQICSHFRQLLFAGQSINGLPRCLRE